MIDLSQHQRLGDAPEVQTEGNFGDHKFCRDGVWELRIDQGAGYGVDYAMDSGAVGYWKNWQQRIEP